MSSCTRIVLLYDQHVSRRNGSTLPFHGLFFISIKKNCNNVCKYLLNILIQLYQNYKHTFIKHEHCHIFRDGINIHYKHTNQYRML